MTTPVVAPRSGFYPPNLRGGTLEVKKNDVIPDIISRQRKENVRNFRRKAGPPTGVAAALSRSDCTGRVGWWSTRGILSHPLLKRRGVEWPLPRAVDSSSNPTSKNSDTNGPACFGGKFKTPLTCTRPPPPPSPRTPPRRKTDSAPAYPCSYVADQTERRE